jgi:hypothetical protein
VDVPKQIRSFNNLMCKNHLEKEERLLGSPTHK